MHFCVLRNYYCCYYCCYYYWKTRHRAPSVIDVHMLHQHSMCEVGWRRRKKKKTPPNLPNDDVQLSPDAEQLQRHRRSYRQLRVSFVLMLLLMMMMMNVVSSFHDHDRKSNPQHLDWLFFGARNFPSYAEFR